MASAIAAIEDAARAAWPPREQELVGGWLLRASDGFTNRANSASASTAAEQLDDVTLARLEAFYRARSLAPTVQVTDRLHPAIDALLVDRGYSVRSSSSVMVADVAALIALTAAPETSASFELWDDAAAWLDASYLRFSDAAETTRAPHLAMLGRIGGARALGMLRADGLSVACGLGVIGGDLLGLFDLVVAPAARGRGHGSALIQGLVRWGAAHGARAAYLQVTERNDGARRLYERLGFAPRYRYWYRTTVRRRNS